MRCPACQSVVRLKVEKKKRKKKRGNAGRSTTVVPELAQEPVVISGPAPTRSESVAACRIELPNQLLNQGPALQYGPPPLVEASEQIVCEICRTALPPGRKRCQACGAAQLQTPMQSLEGFVLEPYRERHGRTARPTRMIAWFVAGVVSASGILGFVIWWFTRA